MVNDIPSFKTILAKKGYRKILFVWCFKTCPAIDKVFFQEMEASDKRLS